MANELLKCPRCWIQKASQRGLLRHLRNPCNLDTPQGRRELAERRRQMDQGRTSRRTKWRV